MTRSQKRKSKYGNRPDVASANPKNGAELQHTPLKKAPNPGVTDDAGGSSQAKAAGPAQEPQVYMGGEYPFNEGDGDIMSRDQGNSQPPKAPGKLAKRLKGLQ